MQTRKRGKNFAISEEMKLLELLQPYKHIIDNKCSDVVTCQLKKDTWEKLSQQLSNLTGSQRSWKTLKDKYKNMNTKLKNEGTMLPRFLMAEEFDPVSSCVSVVYDNIPDPGSSLDSERLDHQDDRTSPIQTESIDEEPSYGVCGKIPLATESQSSLSPIRENRSLDDEKITLIRLQQRFYYNENIRSAEKHRLELRSINLKNELMELELEEKRRCIRKDAANEVKSNSLEN
ncbi:myb/SANT-like DNA-binding domain-containing protein 4 isoform X2 [Drosophila eugracilis]|uniref:myb/SANT-like DNA-binding domain-containing protein 4 isoform X2 n=1 Tax=Drosophila eugracilis TaxID=29029 RepID=UPI001BD9BD9E|nr:myb/SANT-like DNA-binding domain-containing protein 4 isoform X2 [Drosophila eugracilis]